MFSGFSNKSISGSNFFTLRVWIAPIKCKMIITTSNQSKYVICPLYCCCIVWRGWWLPCNPPLSWRCRRKRYLQPKFHFFVDLFIALWLLAHTVYRQIKQINPTLTPFSHFYTPVHLCPQWRLDTLLRWSEIMNRLNRYELMRECCGALSKSESWERGCEPWREAGPAPKPVEDDWNWQLNVGSRPLYCNLRPSLMFPSCIQYLYIDTYVCIF